MPVGAFFLLSYHSCQTYYGGSPMKILKSCLIGLAGFVLGAWLFHAPIAHAGAGTIHVSAVSLDYNTMSDQVSPSGSEVVGFSCVPEPDSPIRKAATCYVATR